MGTERLARINDNLARKISSRNEYDKTIQETEAAYAKIMESSQTLLHVLKRESVNVEKLVGFAAWTGEPPVRRTMSVGTQRWFLRCVLVGCLLRVATFCKK